MTVHEMAMEIGSRLGADMPILGLVQNVNHVIGRIRDKGAWSFFHAAGVINLVAEYTTGTVTVTNGSTTLTGAGTTFTASHVGWKFRGEGGEEYVIAAYVSATELTFDAAWVGSTSAGAEYTLYKDTYDLPTTFDRMGRMWDQTNKRPLSPLTKLDVHSYTASGAAPQRALSYSIFGYTSDLTARRVVFSPAPKEAARVVYTYFKKPAAVTGPSSTPDLPADMHLIVLQGTLARIIKQNTKGRPELWEQYRDERAEFESMLKERWQHDGAMRNLCIRIGASSSFCTGDIAENDSGGYLLTELGEIMFGGGVGALLT